MFYVHLWVCVSLIKDGADSSTPSLPAAVCSLSQKSSCAPGHQLQSSPKSPTTTGPLSRGCDSTAHRSICNKLQEVHSSKLMSIGPCHVIDFHKAVLRTSATKNNYSQPTIPDPETSRHQPREAAKTKWWLQLKVTSSRDNCSQSVSQQRPASVQPLELQVLINKFDNKFSRSVRKGWSRISILWACKYQTQAEHVLF